MSSTINNDLYLSSLQKRDTQSGGSSVLGKDDFLKILMTQLQNQDPASPMEDKEFISQMATFSSLEQLTNMNSSIDQLISKQSAQTFMLQSGMIGKSVSYTVETTNADGTQQERKTGTVKAVLFENDTSKFQLEDGTVIDQSSITKLENRNS
ncbi:flagellar basal-body rod modification protein FlgD [Fictibacillus solisalsi]|uniref:Flagellar basal-body rod modification protein FlgD n=1 Tax=Fictibacillus solisalsi TaxID=459525 RepID=A0A1G9UXJ4_9BACL|nr:flagellar hook assembly protein FlgD [Fictibacillus solisalsi]SDM64662.1 flagellar basal-body rod modification protein FlgD [Fictibacillus solisalsi]